MIPNSTINKFVRDVINLIVENSSYAIEARQLDAPRPSNPYADVDIVTDTSIGWEQSEFSNDTESVDLIEVRTGVREVVMSMGFYKTSAVDNARKVRTGFGRTSVQELLKAAHIGLGKRGQVRELSESLEDGWEERSQFDVTLNMVGSDSDIVRAIETVDIAGEFQSRGLVYNFNIEV